MCMKVPFYHNFDNLAPNIELKLEQLGYLLNIIELIQENFE